MKLKKMISFVTAMTLLTGSMTVLPVSAENSKTPGDVDISGEVNVADAVLLARFNAEDKEITVTEQGLLNADLTGDGRVKADDSTMLLEILAGLASAQTDFASVDLMKGIQSKPAAGVAADDAFKNSQLDLAVKLLQKSCEESKDENVMISPLSIALALSMTANGAKGETLAEMEKLLGGELTISQLNDYYAGWLRSIGQEKEQKLYAADAIWFRDAADMIQVPEEFLKTCADFYGANAYKAPFNQTTVDDINGWVKSNTHGMIDKIIKELPGHAVMVLANALAFEAEWAQKYEDYQVHDREFTREDGVKTTVRMMSSTEAGYLEDNGAVGFVKPYQYGTYSFAAVLPPEGKTVDEYLASLDGEGLQKLLASLTYKYDVYAGLPKFKFEYDNSLKNMLTELGMPTAFEEGNADFTGLNNAPDTYTWIGNVLHKTFIDLTEDGTKAAAVTAVVMEAGCCVEDPPETRTVTLDRPFVFMILDESNGLPVFIGTVKNIGDVITT